MQTRSLIFYKPFGVLSQFTRESNHQTLAGYGPFPRDVYPAGRLDLDSEGLLVLTNDNGLKHQLTDPRFRHPRTYLVQVERLPDARSLNALRLGVVIDGKKTRPAEVRPLETEPVLPPRETPIRYRKNVPTSWLEITLREGRNRQVRRMTAAIGHPTLRLVRIRIGGLTLDGLDPGQWRDISREELEAIRHSLAQ
jgi:pseudouridine synthase